MENIKPTKISKFTARIADKSGKLKRYGKNTKKDNVKVFHYNERGDHSYSVNTINKVAQKMAQNLGPNFKLQINAKFGPQWRSGILSEDTEVWNPENGEYNADNSALALYNQYQGNIKFFNIVVVNYGGGAGGYGKHNDCLYDVFVSAFGGKQYLPWSKPSGLKKYLNIDRDDLVKITLIPILEEKLNCAINILDKEGNHLYESPKANTTKIINVKLHDNHYTIVKEKGNHIVNGVSYKERKILFTCRNGLTKTGMKMYSCDGYKDFTFEEIKEIKRNPLTSEYVIVNDFKYEDDCIEKEYKKYIDSIDALKEATKGVINFYKTGTIKATALKLFEDLNVALIQPDPLTELEAKFHDGCLSCGLMYAMDYEGECHSYDDISFYPAIMRTHMQLPHKQGEFKTITQEDFNSMEFKEYGIYHCEIEGVHKFFMKSKQHYYTSYSVDHAMKLGLKIKIITDGDVNFLAYTADKRVDSSGVFRKYIDYLFPLKARGFSLAKSLINILWGALSQKHTEGTYYIDDLNEESGGTLKDYEEICDISNISDTVMKVKTRRVDKIFKTNYARVKSFLTSKGRSVITDKMMPYEDKIVRIHTDGFLSTTKLKIKTGIDIGNTKYEGKQHCKITGVNKIQFKCYDCHEYINKNQFQEHLKTHD